MNYTPYTHRTFNFAELFCGPGGLTLGAVLASQANGCQKPKLLPVWANDIDEATCITYLKNIHKDHTEAQICTPKEQLNYLGIPHVVHGPVEEIDFMKTPPFDALAFGFPCNDFSQVGEQKGFHGYYGPLYKNAIRAINARNPEWFIAENVDGLRSANRGGALAEILHDLETAGQGYVLTPHLYKFEDYGVPQTRHRIIIIGIRKDIDVTFRVPAPTHRNNHVSVQEALESPPIEQNAPNHELPRLSHRVIKRLEHTPEGKNAWYKGIPEEYQLHVKGAHISQIYKRLKHDEPSYTITGSGGGGTHVYHWSEPRSLTNRERARIQTFPDDFIFYGGRDQVRKQVGMAVPVLGAKAIIEAVLKAFAGVYYESVEANINIESIYMKRDLTTLPVNSSNDESYYL